MSTRFVLSGFQYFHESSLDKWQDSVPENVGVGQLVGISTRIYVSPAARVCVECWIYKDGTQEVFNRRNPYKSYVDGGSGVDLFTVEIQKEGDYWAFVVIVGEDGKAIDTEWVKIAGVTEDPIISGRFDFFEYLLQDRRTGQNEWVPNPPTDLEGGVAVGIACGIFNDGNVSEEFTISIEIRGPSGILATKTKKQTVESGHVSPDVIDLYTTDVWDTYEIGSYYASCELYSSDGELLDSKDKLIARVTILPAECGTDDDCPDGYVCVNGECVPESAPPPPPNGEFQIPWMWIGIGGAAILAAILLIPKGKGGVQPVQIIMPP